MSRLRSFNSLRLFPRKLPDRGTDSFAISPPRCRRSFLPARMSLRSRCRIRFDYFGPGSLPSPLPVLPLHSDRPFVDGHSTASCPRQCLAMSGISAPLVCPTLPPSERRASPRGILSSRQRPGKTPLAYQRLVAGHLRETLRGEKLLTGFHTSADDRSLPLLTCRALSIKWRGGARYIVCWFLCRALIAVSSAPCLTEPKAQASDKMKASQSPREHGDFDPDILC